MIYQIESLNFYDQDADNFMRNMITVKASIKTPYSFRWWWMRMPSAMIQNEEAASLFINNGIHKHLKQALWGKSLAAVKRMKKLKS